MQIDKPNQYGLVSSASLEIRAKLFNDYASKLFRYSGQKTEDIKNVVHFLNEIMTELENDIKELKNSLDILG